MRAVPLTTEEEGVALLAGAWAGGMRGVPLMQSSGVGNCVNMLSLTQIFRFPFLTLVTMRGEWGEFNPWQVPMGSSTAGVFELSGIKVLRASSPDEVREVVEARPGQAYNARTPNRRPALAAPDRRQGFPPNEQSKPFGTPQRGRQPPDGAQGGNRGRRVGRLHLRYRRRRGP